jgi:hypothetical protein
MFSSGKVKLSLRFSGIQQSNNAFNKINIRLKALKGENFTVGEGFSAYNLSYKVSGNNLLSSVAVNTNTTGFMNGVELKSIAGAVKLYNNDVELVKMVIRLVFPKLKQVRFIERQLRRGARFFLKIIQSQISSS